MGGRQRGPSGGGMCTRIADSHCCTADTNTTLFSNYPPIKNKKGLMKKSKTNNFKCSKRK